MKNLLREKAIYQHFKHMVGDNGYKMYLVHGSNCDGCGNLHFMCYARDSEDESIKYNVYVDDIGGYVVTKDDFAIKKHVVIYTSMYQYGNESEPITFVRDYDMFLSDVDRTKYSEQDYPQKERFKFVRFV